MSPRKLTDATKKEILKLYRETEATTSTLAERYGVSSSTVSRFLKNSFSTEEYEELIQKKRLARNPRGSDGEGEWLDSSVEDQDSLTLTDSVAAAQEEEVADRVVEPIAAVQQLNLLVDIPSFSQTEDLPEDIPGDNSLTVGDLKEFFVDTIGAIDEEEDEDDDELDDDWDEEDDDEEEDEDDDEELTGGYLAPTIVKTAQLQILPLSAAAFPKTCYLVIDRAAELITRPLKDFAELGKVPAHEIQQRTLPIFESHRIARRFSKRKEKVIKVPDGRMIEKAHAQLEAKGITRLLMDGRIYALE